jgi:hypothetical protein
MQLTNGIFSKKTRKKLESLGRGQVSIEALLLWAALAGMLALFTPVFAHAMEAYTLAAHTNQFTTFAEELQQEVDWLSLAGPGSQLTMRVPALAKMKVRFFSNEIELTFDHESFSQPKMRTITSAWPIEGAFSPGDTITLARDEEKITIQ